MTDLIERLRADAASSKEGYQAVVYVRTLTEAADELSALRERVEALEGHIREQSEHCRVRFQDGIELGATVWRLALEDVARENAAILAQQGGEDG